MITISTLEKRAKTQAEREKILDTIADHYAAYYSNSVLGEEWTKEKAVELFNFFYQQNKGLFFIAYDEDKPVGIATSVLKPWEGGYQLTDGEIFVIKEYQHKGIATQLMEALFVCARDKYKVTAVQELTYEDENGFPLNWYTRIGYKRMNDLKVIGGDINEIINHLQQVKQETQKPVQNAPKNKEHKGNLLFTIKNHVEDIGPYSLAYDPINEEPDCGFVKVPPKEYRLLEVFKTRD